MSISTSHHPATDLGYLLDKNPQDVHHQPLRFGIAHVIFPVAETNQCTETMLVNIDPIALSEKYKNYGNTDYTLAPFHILASENAVHLSRDHD